MTADATATAQWTAKTYTVTLNKQSGSGGTASVTATYGSAMPSATMPTRTGYTFGGYWTGENGTGTQYYTAAGASARAWDKTSATTLYAKWTLNTYTLTLTKNANISALYYKVNGASSFSSATSSTTVQANYGSTFYVYAAPATGYSTTYNSSNVYSATMGTGGATFSPTATLNKYTLTLTKNTNISSITVTYTSGGTSKTETKTSSTSVQVDYNTTWYAYATPATGYSTTYYDSSHRTSGKMGTSGAAFSPTATLNTYTLTLTKNAHINELYYKINGASSWTKATASTTLQVNYNSTWYAYAVAATGYSTATSSASPQSGTMGTSGATFSPTATAHTYTVKFNKNNADATGTMSDMSFTYDTAQTLTANAFALTGYHFDGWYLNSGGTGTKYANEASVSNLTATNGATVNLYAKWTGNAYTVAFNANGGEGTTASKSITYGIAATLTSNGFTRGGFSFGGWATNAARANAGTVDYANGYSTANGDLTTTQGATVTLYAVWVGSPYTIAINPNGGAIGGASSVQYRSANFGKAEEIAKPTRANYTFAGWRVSGMSGAAACWGTTSASQPNTISGASATLDAATVKSAASIYVKSLSNTSNATVTMTALWERIKYTITVNNNAWHSTLRVTGTEGEGLPLDLSEKTETEVIPSGTFTAYAGATYTFAATMKMAARTGNYFHYPCTVGGTAMVRGANTSDGRATFSATKTFSADTTASVVIRAVTTQIGTNPLSETLKPTYEFAATSGTDVRVTAPETVGSDFLSWGVSPQGTNYTADDNVITVETAANVTLTANYQLSRVNVAAVAHDASAAVATAMPDWVKVGQVVNSNFVVCSDVGYGQTATWRFAVPSGSTMPEGCAFAGWYDADGNLVSESATYSQAVTAPVTLYAKLKSSLAVTWEGEMSPTPLDELGYVVVDGVTVTAKPYARQFVIGTEIVVEAVANASVAVSGESETKSAYFAGWFDGATKEGSARLAWAARQGITIGVSRSLCAYFRDKAEVFSVAIYSRNAATGEYDDGISFSYSGDTATITPFSSRSDYESETGQPLLDDDADATSAIFLRVEGSQRIVVEVDDEEEES